MRTRSVSARCRLGLALAGALAALGLAAPLPSQAASWRVTPVVSTSMTPITGGLSAVACSAPGVCTAVGTQAQGGVLAMRSGAGGWTTEAAPDPAPGSAPAAPQPMPTSVACPTTSECLMVGNYTNDDGNDNPFAEVWGPGGWALAPTPREGADTGGDLYSVSCASARTCYAAGDITPGIGEPMSAVTETRVDHWTGSAWVALGKQPPSPAQSAGTSPDNELAGISCASARSCMGVGYADNGGPRCRHCGYIGVRLDGRAWRYERPSQKAEPVSVSCPAAGWCAAVGGAVAEIWSGRRWKARTLPAARGVDGFTAISCPTTKACVAVASGRGNQVVVERLDRGAWTEQSAPTPVGASDVRVAGLACATPRSCVLVGADRQAGVTVPLIETYG